MHSREDGTAVSTITLGRATPEEFPAIRQHALDDYTRDGRVGAWATAEIARQEFERLLPHGLDTENHHLLAIRSEGRQIGYLWLTSLQRPTGAEAFLLDLVIFPPFRRKGYGQTALLQLEAYVSSLGLKTISLSVLPHNAAAQALYQKASYFPVFTRMTKKLG